MPAQTLQFETCWTIPYPVTTTGGGSALTVCKKSGDPFLAFLTQTTFDDEIVYLHRMGGEVHRHPTPPGEEVISGMAWDPFRNVIWCGQGTTNRDKIIAIDPNTEQVTATRQVLNQGNPDALGCNGFLFCRANAPDLELYGMGGQLLATKRFIDRGIRGVSASPWSWSFIDAFQNEIVVIGPTGNELASAPAPGAPGGASALAFDYVTHASMEHAPKIWTANGSVVLDGGVHDPSVPWNPAPWNGRHRLYIANDTDQTIYAGYLYA